MNLLFCFLFSSKLMLLATEIDMSRKSMKGLQLSSKTNFQSSISTTMPSSLYSASKQLNLNISMLVSICTGTSCFKIFYPSPPSLGILLSWSFITLRQNVEIVTVCFLHLSFPFPFSTYPLYMLILWLCRNSTVYLFSICSVREKLVSLHSGALGLQAF